MLSLEETPKTVGISRGGVVEGLVRVRTSHDGTEVVVLMWARRP